MNAQDERGGKPSASSMARIHFCPGSEPLIQSIPEDQRDKSATEAADSGDRIHAALEVGSTEDLDMTEAEIADRLKALETEAFQKWWAEVIIPCNAAGNSGEVQIIREERLWIRDQDTLEELASAKPDVVYHVGDYALCIDFKSGFKPTTPAERNHQLKTQALAVHCETYCSNIRVVVAQHRFTSMVTAADYNDETIPQAAAELMHDLWRAKQPDAARIPGSWCDYCPAKNHCREVATYSLLPQVVSIGANTPTVSGKALVAAITTAVASLTSQDLAMIERRRGIADKTFEAVKARLKSLPAEELAALGFQLVDGRAMAEVKNAAGVIQYCEENKLIKEEEVMALFDLSIGRLEALVIPRMIEAAASKGIVLAATAAKEQLRATITENGWIDFTSNRSAKILKEL